MSQQLPRGPNTVSVFPNTLKPDQPYKTSTYDPSRYGWCYGDLGILLFLAKLHQTENIPDAYPLLELLSAHCNRRDLENGYLNYLKPLESYDIGFCHGLCGIIHLYKKINVLLPTPLKLTNQGYWETLLLQETDKLTKAFTLLNPATSEPGEADLIGFLEGLAGAGVVLIDQLYEQNDLIPWDTIVTTS